MIAIITKYHPASNLRAPYITAKTHTGHKVRLSIDDSLTTDAMHLRAAATLCEKMGWLDVELVRGTISQGEVFVMIPKITKALTDLLDMYVAMVESGDCGNWDAEKEPEVMTARKVLEEMGLFHINKEICSSCGFLKGSHYNEAEKLLCPVDKSGVKFYKDRFFKAQI